LAARDLSISLSCLDVEINNAFLAESNIPLANQRTFSQSGVTFLNSDQVLHPAVSLKETRTFGLIKVLSSINIQVSGSQDLSIEMKVAISLVHCIYVKSYDTCKVRSQ
jgi:hypothetical protein